MPKNIEDIIPSDKNNSAGRQVKSIRDIPIPEGRRRSIRDIDFPERRSVSDRRTPVSIPDFPPTPVRSVEPEYVAPVSTPSPTLEAPLFARPEPRMPRIDRVMEEPVYKEYVPKPKKRLPGKKVWIAALVSIVVLTFAIMSLFSGATLAYTPKSLPLVFAGDTYTSQKTGEGELLFSVVKLSGDKGTQVSATGEEQVSRKANGTIIVYNNTTTEQKLIATTRFETTDGKTYRIPSAITIPAKKGTTPGSIETTINADQPGDTYNIGLSDFTVPGLKGDPRFTTIYARSKTAMTGGFVGVSKKVDDATLASSKSELQAALKTELLNQAKAQVPNDFILYPNLVSVVFEDLPQTNPTADGITVNVRGNFYGVMFKKSDLAEYLANKKGSVSKSEAVDMPQLDSLDLAFAGGVPEDLLKVTQISFTTTGNATVVWRTDEDALRRDLMGVSKNDIQSILKNYSSISGAEATLRPFWKSTFPKDATRINIKEQKVQ